MATPILCFASSVEQAQVIIDALRRTGIASNSISVLMPEKWGRRYISRESTSTPEGAASGGGTGGIPGGALGWLVGLGTLSIPGLGPFIAAGPILTALGGAPMSAAVGGLSGALIGMGVPTIEARQYEDKLRHGSILISVHTENSAQRRHAQEICRDAGAENPWSMESHI